MDSPRHSAKGKAKAKDSLHARALLNAAKMRAADESSDSECRSSDDDDGDFTYSASDVLQFTAGGEGDMVEFKLMYVRRSDGETEVFTPTRGLELNRPTDEQLDTSPDANGNCDYYREVGADELKSKLWRRKLGAHLARKVGLDQGSGLNYMLADFPENYRLYEHVIKKKDGEAPKAKNHAGGGLDRQDAYLYGHPLGRKKRYRSPNDFYLHLEWLAITPTEDLDPDDCTCKACCPEELKGPPEYIDLTAQKRQATAAGKSKAVAAGRDGRDFSPAARLAALGPSNEVKAAARTTLAAAAAHARSHVTAPVRSVDQELDRCYGIFMFRQGELVWFHRGMAWGLGVVVSRFRNGATPHYKVQPLSWPGHSTATVDLTHDHNLRPWLAWSVPPYTHDSLNNTAAVLSYGTFDFQGLAQGRYGQGTIEVDASILAAKAIDATYTTFAQQSRTEHEPGVVEVRWGGVYLGAEKIWLNDPVRLHNSAVHEARVLVVRSIVERNTKSAFNNETWAALTFVGDVFHIVEMDAARQLKDGPGLPHIPGNAEPPSTPTRMLEDMRTRNNLIIEDSQKAFIWKLADANSTFQLKDIKGRWYESTLLGPILLPRKELEEKAWGIEYEDVVLKLNSRGDCNTANGQRLLPDVRTTTRVQAFGRAVPQNTVLVEDARPSQKPPPAGPLFANNAQPGAYQGGPASANPYGQDGTPSNTQVQGAGGSRSQGTVASNPHGQNIAGPSNTQQHQQQHQQQQQHHHPVPSAPSTNFEEFMDLDFDHSSYL